MVSEPSAQEPAQDPQALAEACTRQMMRGDAASELLGLQVTGCGPGRAVVEMTVRADMVNGWKTCHGGIISSLADTAFAVACNARGVITVASGFDINFLEPAHVGDRLVATAHEQSLRGRSGLYDVRVIRAADGVTVAEFRGRSRSLGRPNPVVG